MNILYILVNVMWLEEKLSMILLVNIIFYLPWP